VKHERFDFPFWTAVDNLGKLFPSHTTLRHTNLFRLSFYMNEDVVKGLLVQAAENTLKRFPYFQVRLRSGFFWWHFVEDKSPPRVFEETPYPCMPLQKKIDTSHPFRFRYYKNRLSLEINHALTDGNGALVLLKAVTKEYLRLKGVEVSLWTSIPNPEDPVPEEEWEDSFWKNFEKLPPPGSEPKKVFRLPYPRVENGHYFVTNGTLSVAQVKKMAKEKECTITEFLLSVLVFAFQECMLALPEKELRKHASPIVLFIPVNLRALFDSSTMRNFFLSPPVIFDPRLGIYQLEEIFPKVKHFMRSEITDKRLLLQQIARNISGEAHPLVRVLPLFIKKWILGSLYRRGMKRTSGSFSNLGPVKLPEGMEPYVQGVEFLPPSNLTTTSAVTALSYKDDLVITFGRMSRWTYLELAFFSTLRKMGLRSKITTNQQEED